MPPDFLLECTACGGESVWDTDAVPPVGWPEVGHPVLWFCQTCGKEIRHKVVDLYVAVDKLHREICLTTELNRSMVDRVMAEMYRHRQRESAGPAARPSAAQEVEEVAEAVGVSPDVVEQICVAEATWMLRRGYIREIAGDG